MDISRTLSALATCLSLALGPVAIAGIINFNPTPALGETGDTIFIDLVWDGTDVGTEYLGDWDVDVTYDNSIVSYQGATFGFGVDSVGCFICGDDSTPGVIDLFEVSFDAVGDLMTNQDSLGNTFTLATLEFLALVDGITGLTFADTVFGNEEGSDFGGLINPALVDGQICIGVNGCDVAAIPTPAALHLLLAGVVLGLFHQKCHRRRRRSPD